jgi:hypothetical protein
MRFAKIVFLIAGIYGLLIIVPLYFMEGIIVRHTPPAITHPEYFYGFLSAALAWQAAFLVVATDPMRYRPMIGACVVEKVTYGIALLSLHLAHRIPNIAFGLGSIDWIFAALFVAAYFSTGSDSTR